MASFDLETFLKVKGNTGVWTIKAIGMSYGVPSCMLNLMDSALAYIPMTILSQILGDVTSSKTKAGEEAAETQKKTMLNSGIIGWASDRDWETTDLVHTLATVNVVARVM